MKICIHTHLLIYYSCGNYFTMRYENGINDKVDLKGYRVKQCNFPIQKDGHNCGVITLKVILIYVSLAIIALLHGA